MANANTRQGHVLQGALWDVFGSRPRPSQLVNVSEQYRSRYSNQFNRLEAVDWANLSPTSFEGIYEPNTFLSLEGYLYILPRIFQMCRQYPDTSLSVDLVRAVIFLGSADSNFSDSEVSAQDERILLRESLYFLNQFLDIHDEYIPGSFRLNTSA